MLQPSIKCNVTTREEAVLAEAYLLTLTEDEVQSASFGVFWMQRVVFAFTNPRAARSVLSPALRARYDYWVRYLGQQPADAEQLSLFLPTEDE